MERCLEHSCELMEAGSSITIILAIAVIIIVVAVSIIIIHRSQVWYPYNGHLNLNLADKSWPLKSEEIKEESKAMILGFEFHGPVEFFKNLELIGVYFTTFFLV